LQGRYNYTRYKGEFIMPEEIPGSLVELFKFRPWPNGDPVAPWVFNQLDKVQLVSLARVGLELTRTVLEAQLKANTQAAEILKGIAGR
jgi:hypothetical protein